MATNNQLPNCPPLRFPEFNDEWERTTLGEIGEIRMCKRILANQTNKEGGVPFFKIGTIGKKEDSYISETLFQEYKSKYHYPNKGQILITCAGTIGRCLIFDGYDAYYQDSNIVWIDNEESRITNPYLFYLLYRTDWSRLNTSTIARLYNDDLRALPIPLPSLAEQQKIATFLSLLDERIEAQRQTIEEQKKQKKALLQQIFSQTLRFPEFSDEWQQTTLGECLSYEQPTKYLVSSTEYSEDQSLIPVLTANKSFILGYTNEDGFYDKGNCIILDDFTLNCKFVPFPFKVKSSAIKILQATNGFSTYTIYALLSSLSLETSEHKRHYLSEVAPLPISLPSPAEQEHIANFLSLIDERIEVEERLLQKYEEQKRYLLRKMFV